MDVLVVDDEELARQRLVRMLGDLDVVREVIECSAGADAVRVLARGSFDLVLLDIQMRDLDGFQVIEQVGIGAMPPVVFVTAHDEFAVRAFQCHALDYLLKPVSRDRLSEVVDRVGRTSSPGGRELSRLVTQLTGASEGSSSRWILVRESGEARVLPTSEIERIEAAGNYVYLHHLGSRLLHRESLASLERRLGSDFIRIHRSTIVNIGCIQSVEPIVAGDYRLHLRSGKTTRLSRNYRQAFMERVDPSGQGA